VRIAMNLSCDALARWKRRAGWVRLGASDDDPPVDSPDQHTVMEQDERKEIVRHAVQSLDPKHRAVIVLRLLDERSTAESAQILGVPEGTIMSRLKRALAKLERMLSPELRP
jgi:RNA polymerase sigma-70 factor (ECF subfamily)